MAMAEKGYTQLTQNVYLLGVLFASFCPSKVFLLLFFVVHNPEGTFI
jgi:hypothetical protein